MLQQTVHDQTTGRRQHRADVGVLVVAVLGASTAGPLIAATAAPALAIAFWRNALAALLLAPFTLVRARAELRAVPRVALGVALLAGVLLAAHFAAFTPSLRFTSVASAAALVCTQSVWAAVFSRILGERLAPRAWLGVGLALCGVLVITGIDLTLSPRALLGDLLAALGGLFGGAYIVAGGTCRRYLTTRAYTLLCYGTAAALLLVLCLVTGQALAGYDPQAWVKIAALAVVAQLLGHSLFNHVLRTTSATVVGLVTLFTVPLSAVIAALALGQLPPLASVPALALVLTGVGLVVAAQDRSPAPSADRLEAPLEERPAPPPQHRRESR